MPIISLAMAVALAAVLAALIGNVGVALSAKRNCQKIEELKAHAVSLTEAGIERLKEAEDNFKRIYGEERTFDPIRSEELNRRVVLPRWQVEMNRQLAIQASVIERFAPHDCPVWPWS